MAGWVMVSVWRDGGGSGLWPDGGGDGGAVRTVVAEVFDGSGRPVGVRAVVEADSEGWRVVDGVASLVDGLGVPAGVPVRAGKASGGGVRWRVGLA